MDVINEVCMINPSTNWAIDPKELDGEYKKNETLYRRRLAYFRPQKVNGDDRKLTPYHFSPYSTNLFVKYFTDTYHSLCQVCAEDANDMIPNRMLVICMDIKNRYINRPFDYASLVVEGLHNALFEFKAKKSINFKYYYLLMHIFVYKGLKVWYPDLQITTTIGGEPLPVQEWTYI